VLSVNDATVLSLRRNPSVIDYLARILRDMVLQGSEPALQPAICPKPWKLLSRRNLMKPQEKVTVYFGNLPLLEPSDSLIECRINIQ